MKAVYRYDEQTKELLGIVYAQESPLEPGTFLIPEYCTEVEPNEPKLGYSQKFINGMWEYIKIKRNNANIFSFKFALFTFSIEFKIAFR
jgi:hypothetical protein